MRWLPLLLVACGSAPPPPAPIPVTPPAKPLPPPAPVTCADAGVILRGVVEDSRKAGPAKEAALASACLTDKWSQEILDCIGSSHEAHACLGKLTDEQRTALDTKLTAWTTVYEGETWETLEEERIANAPPQIPCTSIVGNPAVLALAPAVAMPLGEERDFVMHARRISVLKLCEAWPREVRACVVDAGGALSTCRSKLDATQEQALAGKLAAIDATMTKIAAAKKKPAATYECKAVVATHYSDAAWKGKAELAKDPKATRAELAQQAADRKAMIADSRKAMTDACGLEAWNSTQRVCELVDGGELCSAGVGRTGARWGFPAVGIYAKTGITECDNYAQSIRALLTCPGIPQPAKDSIKQSFETMLATIAAATTPEAKRTWSASCQQADTAIRQSLTSMGCTP